MQTDSRTAGAPPGSAPLGGSTSGHPCPKCGKPLECAEQELTALIQQTDQLRRRLNSKYEGIIAMHLEGALDSMEQARRHAQRRKHSNDRTLRPAD